MFGKIIGAMVGKRIADRYGEGGKGMLVGALVPLIAKRAMGPLGLALAGGWAAKKYYDSRKRRAEEPVVVA